MRRLMHVILVAAFLAAPVSFAQNTIRVGLQSTGTFSWVAHAMEYFNVPGSYGVTIEPIMYATKQASELALRAGEVDIVVDDFVGAVQMRERGVPVQVIYPYGKAVGGVVVPADSDVQTVADLRGKTVAAASLDDKSLLILRALTSTKYGFDPQVDGQTLDAAPWLMTGLMDSGDIDAGIPYWHFVSRMTYNGEYRDVMMVSDMLAELGLRSDLPILVLVARDELDASLKTTFIEMMLDTTAQMAAAPRDGFWQSVLDEELYSLPDPSAFPEVIERWVAGLPDGWTDEQITGLSELVEQLIEIAGSELVGIDEIPADAYTTAFVPN